MLKISDSATDELEGRILQFGEIEGEWQLALKPWFQGKLPFTFNLPELQNSSFKLIGGRVTYFQHSPGAQLLFGLRNHQLSVFILKEHPGMVPTQAGIITVQQMAFNLETWEEGGLRYVIISDSSPADVHELGQLLRAAAHS